VKNFFFVLRWIWWLILPLSKFSSIFRFTLPVICLPEYLILIYARERPDPKRFNFCAEPSSSSSLHLPPRQARWRRHQLQLQPRANESLMRLIPVYWHIYVLSSLRASSSLSNKIPSPRWQMPAYHMHLGQFVSAVSIKLTHMSRSLWHSLTATLS
jgi:hypothetical protein